MDTTSTPPAVTVLVTALDRQDLLNACLESVRAQSHPHFRVIVLDQGSGTPITLPPEAAADKRFSVLRAASPHIAVPLLLEQLRDADSPYLAVLSGHDRWEPDKLAEQMAVLEGRPEVAACFTHALFIDDFGFAIDTPPPPFPDLFNLGNRTRAAWVRHLFVHGNCLCASSALVRTDALHRHMRVLPFRQLGDFSSWVQLLAAGDLYVIDRALTGYRVFMFGEREAIASAQRQNLFDYEQSRVLHQFRDLPPKLLLEAFGSDRTAARDAPADGSLYNAAMHAGSPAHVRFAAELAEDAFRRHFEAGRHELAATWSARFAAAAGRSSSAASSGPAATEPAEAPERRKPLIGVLTEDPSMGACFNLRIGYVLTLLSNHVELVPVATITTDRRFSIDDSRADACDAFIVQRAFPSAAHAAVLERIRATGKPIIYESDDQLDELPPENAEFAYYAPRIPHVRRFIRDDAHLLVLSTAALVGHYEDLGVPTAHFANQLPAELWQPAAEIQRQARENADRITIGFAGTIARGRDLAIIEEALLRIARAYGERVRIVLWGAATDSLRTVDNVSIINAAVAYPLYPRRLASFGFDIGLVPLEDTPFNRCKSDLKWLEYSALGIASVVSDVPVYAEAKAHGLAVAVPNDADAWFAALVRLIEDEHERKALGRRAQEYVLRQRSLEGHIHEYAEILNTVLPPHLHLPAGEALALTPLRPLHSDEIAIPADAYHAWAKRRTIQEVDAEVLAERMVSWPLQPRITLFSFARADEFELLAQTTDALKDQLYPGWRFVVVSDQPNPDPIFEQAEFLGWVQVDALDDPAGLAELANALLEQVGGDIFAWLPAGTRLAPHALLLAADRFMQADDPVAAVYADHDYYDREGSHRPQLKPGFDLEWLRCADYIGPAIFFKTADALALGGFQPYAGAMLFDLVLRLAEHPEVAIAHQADVLLSIPNRGGADDPIARQVAVEQHLQRSGAGLEVLPGLLPGTFRLEPPPSDMRPAASVIVAVRDVFHLVERCLESLFSHTDHPDFEVVVVDNGSEDPDIGRLYASLHERGRRLRVVEAPGEFSHARLLNHGASAADGEVLVFIHADCEFRDPAWLGRLVAQAGRADIGIVCPLVLQPEFGFVDSAGLFLGGAGSSFATSRPALRGLQMSDEGYMGMLHVARTVSAAPTVGLTVSRDRFRTLGGFDECLARSQFEIDFCLRAAARGWKSIYLPHARVIHHGGAIIGRLLDTPADQFRHAAALEDEQRSLIARWAGTVGADPYSSPHFSMTDGNVRLESDIPLAWQTERDNRARALGFPIIGGSGEYRVRLPFRGLVEAGWMHAENVPTSVVRMPSVAEMLRLSPDVVLLHQRFARNIEEAVRDWKHAIPALRVVFGMDDRSDAIPFKSSVYHAHKKHNPDSRNRLRRMMALADAVAVTTAPLADLVRELAGDVDVRIIPNSLDRRTWAPLRPSRRPEGKPRVGWIGAQQHRGDLELIIPVLEATHRDVDWVFMGMWLPEFQGLVKEKHPWVDFQDYAKTIAGLDLDLAIAPLEVNEFNEAKSNLRLLEYGALGYPVVCTDIHPYRTDAPPVTHLPNDPARWIEAILDKVRDRDGLQREGALLREWVMSRYLLEHHLPAWNDILLGT